MSSSNMNIAQEINELSLNTDNTAQQYACYLKKFAVFVGQTGVLTAGIEGRDFSIAGVEFDTDEDDEEENQQSINNVNLKKNDNNKLSKKVKYNDGKNTINLTFDMREYH